MRTPLGRPSARRSDRSRPRPSPPPRRPKGPWKHGPVAVVGLIGGMGSGKSLVASLLEAKGAHVLDADSIGHTLLNQTPARDEVVSRFGPDILKRDRSGLPLDPPEIDRAILGKIVFSDPPSLKALEAILHPRMRQTIEKAIARDARKQEPSVLVLDAAVLLEARWHTLCDLVVFVEAPVETRQARLLASRGWSPEMLAARESSQFPLNDKKKRADFVIENSGDQAALADAVSGLWDKVYRSSSPGKSPRRGSSDNPPV